MNPEAAQPKKDPTSFDSDGTFAGEAIPILLIAAFSVLVLRHLLFSGSWFPSHEGVRYFVLLDQFLAALRHGFAYPRWLPELNGGYGYPTFIYYQPGFFFLASLFRFLDPSPLMAMKLSLLFLFLVAGWSVYGIGRVLAGRRAALLAALMYLLTPYLYVDLFVRGDLSELFGMLLLPVPFLFLFRLWGRSAGSRPGRARLDVLLLALATAVVVISHPAITLFFVPLVGITALLLSGRTAAGGGFLSVSAAAIAAGVALAAPYWLVLLQMWRYVPHANLISGYNTASMHVVYAPQLFMRTWRFGGSLPGMADTMSFQLGLPHFVVAATGFWRARRDPIPRFAFLLYLLLALLMSNLAAPLWDLVRPLSYVQFPWRLLAIIALVQAVPMLGLSRSLESVRRWKASVVMAGILAIAVVWYGRAFAPEARLDLPHEVAGIEGALRSDFITFANVDEFTPRTATAIQEGNPRGDSPIVEVEDEPGNQVGPAVTLTDSSADDDYRIRATAESSGEGRVRINQIYFPGWRVQVDGRTLPRSVLERHLTVDGRMSVSLPAGRHTLDAFYGGPPHSAARNLATLIVSAALLLLAERGLCARSNARPVASRPDSEVAAR